MAEEEKQEAEEEEKSPPSTMKIVIIAVIAAVVLSGGMAGGAMYMMGVFDPQPEVTAEGEAEEAVPEEEPKGPAQYHSMDPKFVISFRDQKSARFMQFSLQLMTRDNDIMQQIDSHMPAIRSSLLLLFGQQQYADMVTREGKEQLLTDVVADVNSTLTRLNDGEEPPNGVESAYFDSFVIQ